MKTYLTTIVALSILSQPLHAYAVDYYCLATKKYDSEHVYTEDIIQKYKYATKIEESNGKTYLSRCSHTTAKGHVTCDKYEVDRVEFDSNVNIKKYYLFRAQANFQIFSNMTSLEDNGRGSVQYGKCTITSP